MDSIIFAPAKITYNTIQKGPPAGQDRIHTPKLMVFKFDADHCPGAVSANGIKAGNGYTKQTRSDAKQETPEQTHAVRHRLHPTLEDITSRPETEEWLNV